MSQQRDPQKLLSLFDRLFSQLPEFPESEVRKIEAVLVGGEFLVAIENLTTQLYELDIALSSDAQATLTDLANMTGLAPRYLTPLGL